jgi:hypothetical protein
VYIREESVHTYTLGLVTQSRAEGGVDESKPGHLISLTSMLVPGTGVLVFQSKDTPEFEQTQWLVWNLVRTRIHKISTYLGCVHNLPDVTRDTDNWTRTAPYGFEKDGCSGEATGDG